MASNKIMEQLFSIYDLKWLLGDENKNDIPLR